ncbi:MAG: MATE family efflux transporter, partial [Bacteroidia bacterium]|nr:MATE family efflux transporter [Bacteroidia bacterium]
ACILFAFMVFGCPWLFNLMVDSEVIYSKSLEYIDYRSWGVFASYVGVAIVALYTGVARPVFIVYDAILLIVINIILNYVLIFGHFGFPEMGIAGAGLASTIAEYVAIIAFFIYMLLDSENKKYQLFRLPEFDFELIKTQFKIGAPIVAQAVVSLGSWFIFFGIVENIGERELAMTNLARMVYLILSIPCWGYATGINTIVSNVIGQGKLKRVEIAIWKTAKLCWATTMIFAIPILFFPEVFLYPLLGSEDMSLVTDTRPIFYILFIILTFFCIGGIYFNGLAGTGATFAGLKIQLVSAVVYIGYIYLTINVLQTGLLVAWFAEVIYWIIMLVITMWYVRRRSWERLRF